jgi:hypothetical protein
MGRIRTLQWSMVVPEFMPVTLATDFAEGTKMAQPVRDHMDM